jgi:cytochrome c oxidase assembly protein subunit 15
MQGETTIEAHSGAAGTGSRSRPHASWRTQQALWLLTCCALVYAMVVLGGVTRLTGSGLSMVDWEPVSGVMPPLTDAAWDEEFARYRESPEFTKVNYWMTVADFKRIFWFEWAHRLLGRGIGIAFALPFLYFLMRGRIERAYAPKYVAMFILGGLQGLLGWYMVKSGLVDDPHVSQYRLTAHLSAAIVIYLVMLWTALDLLRPTGEPGTAVTVPAWLPGAALAVGALILVTLVSGGFVAGLKAGFAYNTFPRMGEQWIPEGLYAMQPMWLSAFEDVTTVQFNHRLLAIGTLAAVVVLWLRTLRAGVPGALALAAHAVLHATLIQVALGISTLLLRVPVSLAATHQAGALLVLTAVTVLAHLSARHAGRP